METLNLIYWKNLVALLQDNKEIPANIEIDYNNEKIDFKNASLLNRYGFNVPEILIEYNDDDIDFSDDADITEEDIETGKITWSVKANFILEPEIKQWIKNEKIEINTLIPKLMKNFYETLKEINTAI